MYERKHVTRALTLIVGVGALSYTSWYFLNPIKLTLNANSSDLIGEGKSIYSSQCASCHGIDLEGQPNWRVRNKDGKLPAPPHDETGHTWHHSTSLLIDLTKKGPQFVAGLDYKTDMPAFEKILTDDEVVAVLSYIKSTWTEEVQKRHDSLNAP